LKNSIENEIKNNSKILLGGDLELSTKNKALDLNFLDELKEKIMEWEPKRIIIGKPLNMDGTRSDFMEKVERFAKKLGSVIDIEIEFFDERLTSFEARQLDEDSEMIDDVAAKIILDSWLNNEYS